MQLFLISGEVLERTVHGQKGSMHDPLSSDELDAKFQALVADRVAEDLPALLRQAPDEPDLSASDLARVLRESSKQWAD